MARSRGVSPLGIRVAAVPCSTQYNPQQWHRGTEQLGAHGQQVLHPPPTVDPDGGLENPPPPYSARMGSSDEHVTTQPSGPYLNASASTATPQASSHRMSSDQYSRQRPVSMMPFGHSIAPTSQPVFAAPPTSRSSSSSRVTTKLGQFVPGFASGSRQSQGVRGGSDSISSSGHENGPHIVHDSARYAPGSRRAMSADAPSRNAAYTVGQPSLRRQPQTNNWSSGMHLPGPPAAPPPPSSCSTSVSGVGDASAAQHLRPAARPRNYQAPSLGTRLEPPPPTPSEWKPDEERAFTRTPTLLHIAPSSAEDSEYPNNMTQDDNTKNPGSGVGLARSVAKRDPSAKGIRERRRASGLLPQRRSVSFDNQEDVALSIATAKTSSIQSPDEPSGVCHSRDSTPTIALLRPKSEELSDPDQKVAEESSTTQMASDAHLNTQHVDGSMHGLPAQTPPLSPGRKLPQLRLKTNTTGGSGRTLPTPPSTVSLDMHSANFRPISHILHLPNDDSMLSTYLSSEDQKTVSRPTMHPKPDPEAVSSVARHKQFIRRELMATTDEERLHIFSDYILSESSIRRKRYSGVFAKGSFDTASIRARLFEQTNPAPPMQSRSSSTADSSRDITCHTCKQGW